MSLGDAVAELIRSSSREEPRIRTDRGFPYFEVPNASQLPKVTAEEMQRLIDEMNEEEDLRKALFVRR